MAATKENCSEGFCLTQFLANIRSGDIKKVIELNKELFRLEDSIAAGPTQQSELKKLKNSSAYLEQERKIKEIEVARNNLQKRIDLVACPICPYSSSNIILEQKKFLDKFNH